MSMPRSILSILKGTNSIQGSDVIQKAVFFTDFGLDQCLKRHKRTLFVVFCFGRITYWIDIKRPH
jgi:hypothetical protein